MRPSNNQENKILSDTYWRVQLIYVSIDNSEQVNIG